jgi:hypothetical protein
MYQVRPECIFINQTKKVFILKQKPTTPFGLPTVDGVLRWVLMATLTIPQKNGTGEE